MNTPFWCVVTVDNLPEGFHDGIILQEGFREDHESSLDGTDAQYVLLCRTVACKEAQAHTQVKVAVHNLGIETVSDTWTLSREIQDMVKSERRTAKAMSAGDVSIHSTFVAFKRGNIKAMEQAKSIIALVAIRKRWQFWR